MQTRLLFVTVSMLPLLLAGCNGGAGPVDSKAFLGTLDGPKVPGVNDALLQAAQQAEAQGNFKMAAQQYEQVLEKTPDDANVTLALADSYRRDGQTQKAISVYDALLAKDAKNVAAKEGKGLALIASGDFDTPAVLFDEVMQVDAKRWKTLNALGILFTTRNLQPEAQQYFKEALKYHADSASIYNNLGLSQALERNFDGATTTLTKASGLAGAASVERKRIDLNTALVLASAGKVEDAKGIAERYLAGAELDNNLGLYAHLAKDDKMAKAYLNKALSDSKVYYAKAWENLEDINKQSAKPADAPKKAVPEKVAKEAAPKATPVKKAVAKGKQNPAIRTAKAADAVPEANLAPAAGPSAYPLLPPVSLADAPPAPPPPSYLTK